MPELGRPSKYRPEFCEQAHEHCLMGATDIELAECFGIAESTLYEWKKQFPEFSEAIKSGKEPANAKVAAALYSRATGAEWTEQQAFKLKTVVYDNGKRVSEDERVEVVDVVRGAPPDTTAGIFWLKNRRKEDWRDRHELGGSNGGPLQVEDVTFTEVARRIAFILQHGEGLPGPMVTIESQSDEGADD